MRDIVLEAQLSDPVQNPLHQRWLGRRPNVEALDPDAYAFRFSVQEMCLDRGRASSRFRILTMTSVDFQSLLTQWPSAWITASPFLGGDPNAPLLAVELRLQEVAIVEHAPFLRKWVDHVNLLPKHTPSARSPHASKSRVLLPRIMMEVECGSICGRVTFDADGERTASAMELRCDGFSISLASRFWTRFSPRIKCDNLEEFPLQFIVDIIAIVRPVFVRVRSNWDTWSSELDRQDADLSDVPVFLSLETFEIIGKVDALADIKDDAPTLASVDIPSMLVDLHGTTDVLCIELWHPVVIKTLCDVVAMLPRKEPSISPSSPPLVDFSYPGLSLSLGLARSVVYVTSSDINPEDKMELSRGIALRATGMSFHYCSLRSSHAHRFKQLPWRSLTRHKLYLPEERLVAAVAAAKATTTTTVGNTSTFLGIALSELSLRSAVATQYVPDDPLIAERDEPALRSKEFLRISNMKSEIAVHGTRSGRSEGRDIILRIPYIRANFQFGHVYSVLLACRAFRTFSQARRRPSRLEEAVERRPDSPSYRFNGTVKTIQILWALPRQRLVSRFDSVTLHSGPGELAGFRLQRGLVWVLVPHQSDRWETDRRDRWEEFIRLQKWDVSLSHLHAKPNLAVSVDGDSARVRIPFDFILANLILDVSVTIKALRHLIRICIAGNYTSMLTPEPEGPKMIPNLSIQICRLYLEAADDPFESKLAIIWRAGSEAAKHRQDREDAFQAKVVTILADNSGNPQAAELESDYQFSPDHSVSIEQARARLNEVHSLDWALRLDVLKEERSKLEDELFGNLLGTFSMKDSGTVPNLVEVNPVDRSPPLFRAALNNLSLRISPVSFPVSELADFLYQHGDGLPKDTQFSLLIPLHINLALSSLRFNVRDYPLPLLNVPPHADPTISAWEFDTDLVIAEEMGTDLSVDWITCPIVEPHDGVYGAAGLTLSVPKTIMPVKSYANPVVNVTTPGATSFCWGVSYAPATQDLMRVVDTLSSSPRDSSPSVGFWDKVS